MNFGVCVGLLLVPPVVGVLVESPVKGVEPKPEAGDSEFTPQSAAFINILTKDNVNYCAVDERILNPEFDPNQALQQSLLFSSCEEYFLEYRKIFEEEQALESAE